MSRTVGIQVRFAYVNLFSSVGERQMASAASPNQIVLFPFQISSAVDRCGRMLLLSVLSCIL